MSSFRQIEANRRNARLSTGPVTEQGKKRSRQNALRHGLTAETVIDGLEDSEDYAAFEMAVTGDYDAQTAVGRELVLRLASVLWRLRRATAIEAGLFEQQARVLLQFRQRRQTQQARQKSMNEINKEAIAENDGRQEEEKLAIGLDPTPAINSMASHAPMFGYLGCRLTRLTGSVGMKPRYGAKPVRSCSRCSDSCGRTAPGHGRVILSSTANPIMGRKD